MQVAWDCPHCGFVNKATFTESDIYGVQLRYCDSEAGGCDGQVVLKFEVETNVKIFTLTPV
jgi:hypothetical protein